MKTLIKYFAFSLYVVYSFCSSNNSVTEYAEDTLEESHGKIIYTSVIFRHGDRTIKAHYPNDLYPIIMWRGILRLSKKGKQQVYDLGKWYRKRYENLLADLGYNQTFVRIDSSNTDRALMSAQLFLAAVFPPTEEEIWSTENLASVWQPIPIHTSPKQNDYMIGVSAPCPRYDYEQKYWTSAPEVLEFYRKYEEDIRYTCQHAGYPSEDCSSDDVFLAVRRVWTVYNALYIEEGRNLTLPKWSKKIYPEPSRKISEFYFLAKTYSLEMRRLKGGPLLQNIIKEMNAKQNGSLERIFHFYSGQETTIAVFLHTLDVYNMLLPEYTASVMIELREKNNEHYVTMLYRNTTSEAPHLLQVPGCSLHCTLDQFVKATNYLIVDDWTEECQIAFTLNVLHIIAISSISILLLAAVGVAIVIFFKYCTCKRKTSLDYDSI